MRKWFFGLLGCPTIDPASVIHNWRNQVSRMVPAAHFPAIWREILNGHLSLMDLKYGIHSSAERSAEHQDALKYRAQHEEGAEMVRNIPRPYRHLSPAVFRELQEKGLV